MTWALGVDLGTSTTTAALGGPGGVRPVLVDSAPLLGSAVFAPEDGGLLVGRDAEFAARSRPRRIERALKRRIGAATHDIDGTTYPMVDLLAAILARSTAPARRANGGLPMPTLLTHPADWPPERGTTLVEAAVRIGLGPVHVVPEPVAAATALHRRGLLRVPVGGNALLYDHGAAGCVVSLLALTPAGWLLRATESLGDIGGAGLDTLVRAELLAGRPDIAARWAEPSSDTDRRARDQFWSDATTVRELLSRAGHASVVLPGTTDAVVLTRDRFEALATPPLARAVDATRALAGIANGPVVPVLLGGVSRTPLVAALLAAAFAAPPVLVDDPDLVTAEGAALLGVLVRHPGPVGPPVVGPPDPWAPGGPSVPSPPRPVPGGPDRARPVAAPQQPVQLIEISLPDGGGYTIRAYLDPGSGRPAETPAFLTGDGRLLLFGELPALVAQFAGRTAPAPAVSMHTAVQIGSVEHYELDLVLPNLSGGRDGWEPEILLPAFEIVAELGTALGDPTINQLLGEGSYLDAFDDAIWDASVDRGHRTKRRIREFDTRVVIDLWQQALDALTARTRFHDG